MSTDYSPSDVPPTETVPSRAVRWLTKGVWGIGLASFPADVGHEIPYCSIRQLRDYHARWSLYYLRIDRRTGRRSCGTGPICREGLGGQPSTA